MTGSVRVLPPAWGVDARIPETVAASIDRWVCNQPLAELVGAFGGRMSQNVCLADKLFWLDAFSAEHWDFRAGLERNLARKADFNVPLTNLILDVAEALGLLSPTVPSSSSYDHVVILGGLARACLLRPRYGAKLISDGLQTGSVAALSAYRKLRGDENGLLESLGLTDMRNEMDVMRAGLVDAFTLGPPDDEHAPDGTATDFATSMVRTWRSNAATIRLVVAPSSEPEMRRANTADTYAYWANRWANLSSGATVLMITSAIYVPYQHADAVRLLALPHGCSVETVGINLSDENLGVLRQSFTPANYLQEIRSAIRATRALYAAVSESVGSATE